jgi:hypothetical protein
MKSIKDEFAKGRVY